MRTCLILTAVGVMSGLILQLPAGTQARAAKPVRELLDSQGTADRPVSVSGKALAVSKALSDLGAADVRLSAVQHLADRRMTLFVHQQPRWQVLDWVAQAWTTRRYPARWRRVSPMELELWQDPRAEVEWQQMIEADRVDLLGSLRRLAAALDRGVPLAAARVDRESARNLLRPTNDVGQPQLRVFGGLPEAAQAAVVRGQGAVFPFTALPPETQDSLLRSSFNGQGGGGALPPADQHRVLIGSEVTLRLELDPRESTWVLFLHRMHDPKRGRTGVGVPLGELGLSEAEAPAGAREVPSKLRSSWLARLETSARTWKEFADFQEFLARETGHPVVSDYYHDKPPPTLSRLAGAATLRDLLDQAGSEPVSYRWRVDRKGLLFFNRRRLLDQLGEVPAAFQERVVLRHRERGFLDLTTVAVVAHLNGQQLLRLERDIPGIRGVTGVATVLRWYAALPPIQQRTARIPPGLPLHLSGSAQHLLRESVASRYVQRGGPPDPNDISVSVHQEVEGSQVVLRTRLYRSNRPVIDSEFRQPITGAPQKLE